MSREDGPWGETRCPSSHPRGQDDGRGRSRGRGTVLKRRDDRDLDHHFSTDGESHSTHLREVLHLENPGGSWSLTWNKPTSQKRLH